MDDIVQTTMPTPLKVHTVEMYTPKTRKKDALSLHFGVSKVARANAIASQQINIDALNNYGFA